MRSISLPTSTSTRSGTRRPSTGGYSLLTGLSGKSRFTCFCPDGTVCHDHDDLFKHFSKSKCIRADYPDRDHRNRLLALVKEGQDTNRNHSGLFAEMLRVCISEQALINCLAVYMEKMPTEQAEILANKLEWGQTTHYLLAGLGYSDLTAIAKGRSHSRHYQVVDVK